MGISVLKVLIINTASRIPSFIICSSFICSIVLSIFAWKCFMAALRRAVSSSCGASVSSVASLHPLPFSFVPESASYIKQIYNAGSQSFYHVCNNNVVIFCYCFILAKTCLNIFFFFCCFSMFIWFPWKEKQTDIHAVVSICHTLKQLKTDFCCILFKLFVLFYFLFIQIISQQFLSSVTPETCFPFGSIYKFNQPHFQNA